MQDSHEADSQQSSILTPPTTMLRTHIILFPLLLLGALLLAPLPAAQHPASASPPPAALVAAAAAGLQPGAARPDGSARVSFGRAPGEVRIHIGGQPFATYGYADPHIPRPYFAHVRTADGIQVTRNHPPLPGQDPTDHDLLHPGLWMAFGDLNGEDFWREKATVRHERFRTEPKADGTRGGFSVVNRYVAADGVTTVCRETARYTIETTEHGRRLLWDSTFEPVVRELVFGDQEEMGLGARLATALTVRSGGEMVDAAGNRNEKGIRGKQTAWCDYSGMRDGRRVGITLMAHPDNFRGAWWHARDYGLIVANPFGRASLVGGEPSRVVVKPGERLRLRFGVLVHSDSPNARTDSAAAFRAYAGR